MVNPEMVEVWRRDWGSGTGGHRERVGITQSAKVIICQLVWKYFNILRTGCISAMVIPGSKCLKIRCYFYCV